MPHPSWKYYTNIKAYSDLTGKFPFTSSQGNQYILIVYDYDSNAILVEALNNRQAATIVKTWTTINDKYASRGVQSKIYILDK